MSTRPRDFPPPQVCREGTALPAHVVGAIATNGDIHANVMRKCGLASLNAALG